MSFMDINKFIKLVIICLLFISCSKKNIKQSVIKEKSLDLQVLEAYEEGINSLEAGDVLFAAKKLDRKSVV